MPDLQVIYIAGFNVDKNTGRNKATKEKAAALEDLLPKDRFRFFCPGYSGSRLIAYLKVFFFDLRMLWQLLLLKKNARVIERTTFLPLTNIFLWLRGIPMIYELHTDMRDEIKHYQAGRLEKLLLHGYVFFEQLNLRLAKAVIYNHPVLQQVMSARYKKTSIYTYNGSNVDDFVPMDTMQCRRELGLDERLNYYLFAGTLAKWRGVDLLVGVFNNYMSEEEVLLIVGNAAHAYGREIKKMADGNRKIVFVNEVGIAEIVKYINAADICLVPVKPVLTSPGNPLKLYDYIACGKPVIGQDGVLGCADEIYKYELGMVADFYDQEQAANTLKNFCGKYDRDFFKEHNRHVAVNSVSWKQRMIQWIYLLETI